MSQDPRHLSELPTADWAQVQRAVEAFEERWRRGERPELGEYLVEASPPETLRALVHVDLERRLESGEAARAEEYLSRFPELADDETFVVELLAAEFDGRRRREGDVSVDEYRERYPQLGEALKSRLAPAPTDGHASRSGAFDSTVRFAGAAGGPEAAAPPEVGHYEDFETLGAGGMGLVFKARHRTLGRTVAIKTPRAELAADGQARERFLREARAAARLRHPNIAEVYEVGESGGRPFLAMAFVQGPTLRDLAKERKFTAREACELVARLADAIVHAHSHGVVHRDIKPANVLMDEETGEPVLTDFGLAKELDDANVHMTQTGQVMGTPAYMAPEQAAGESDVGPAADIYALGAVLYELLCGRPPFTGGYAEVIHQVRYAEPKPPRKLIPKLSRDAETICLKCLAKRPRDRYATAQALAEDLRRFCEGEAISARPQGFIGRTARRIRRRPLVATFTAVAVFGLLAAGFLIWSSEADRQLAAQLRSDIQSALRSDTWSAEHLRRTLSLVEQLEAVSPSSDPAQARREPVEALRRHLRGRVDAPRIADADADELRPLIALLSSYDRDSADLLESDLKSRLAGWRPALSLRAPFENAAEVFGEREVTPGGDQLLRVVEEENGDEPAQDDERKAGALTLTRQCAPPTCGWKRRSRNRGARRGNWVWRWTPSLRTAERSSPWRSRPTERPWRQAGRTRSSACGISRPASNGTRSCGLATCEV